MKAVGLFVTLPCVLAAVLFFPGIAAAEQPIRVRLYSIHPPAEVSLTAASGSVAYRSCDQCASQTASRLLLRADHDLVKTEGKSFAQVMISQPYRLIAPDEQPLALSYPLVVTARKEGLVLTIAMPLEDYVTAALAGESGGFTSTEAMRAMAVTVRSYAMHFLGRHQSEGFDFCDSTHCQDLRLAISNRLARDAAQRTAGEVLWFQNAPAATYYHQSCGGQIGAAAEVWPASAAPYLRGHSDAYCVRAPLKWESRISRQDLGRALQAAGIELPPAWTSLEIALRTPSGRASRLQITGGQGAMQVSASTLRFAVGRALGWNRIRSDLYDIHPEGDWIVFQGTGSGHGVGLCQLGAEQMGKSGKDYRAILAYYFPGTELRPGDAAHLSPSWSKVSSQHFDLLTLSPQQDQPLLTLAEKFLVEAQRRVGWEISFRGQLKVFPSLDEFRDITGQPGWVAASTRGHIVRLQPLTLLRSRGALESTLRHEIFHLVLESKASPDSPLWLREGLVLVFDGSAAPGSPVSMTGAEMDAVLRSPKSKAEMERAYAAARRQVGALIAQNGEATVLEWLRSGLPHGTGRLAQSPGQPSGQ